MRIDAHLDTALWLAQGDIRSAPQAAADFERMAANLDIAFLAVFVHPEKSAWPAGDGLRLLTCLLDALAENADLAQPLLWREDLSLPFDGVKALITAEGGELLGDSAELLGLWYERGLRNLGLTWNGANQLAAGCAAAGGLTPLGRRVVRECNRMGILVDAAHLAAKGFWQLLQASERPIIVSHAACAALRPHPRNLTDAQIRALAAQRGVLGITFADLFLAEQAPTLADVVAHIVHAVEIGGIDCVGIGSDFDGADMPRGLESVEKLPDLYAALVQAGFRAEEVAKICGGNFYRLLQENLPPKGKSKAG